MESAMRKVRHQDNKCFLLKTDEVGMGIMAGSFAVTFLAYIVFFCVTGWRGRRSGVSRHVMCRTCLYPINFIVSYGLMLLVYMEVPRFNTGTVYFLAQFLQHLNGFLNVVTYAGALCHGYLALRSHPPSTGLQVWEEPYRSRDVRQQLAAVRTRERGWSLEEVVLMNMFYMSGLDLVPDGETGSVAAVAPDPAGLLSAIVAAAGEGEAQATEPLASESSEPEFQPSLSGYVWSGFGNGAEYSPAMLEQVFSIECHLGSGSFGLVQLATARGDYAVKYISQQQLREKAHVRYAFQERDALRTADHPGVVQLFASFQYLRPSPTWVLARATDCEARQSAETKGTHCATGRFACCTVAGMGRLHETHMRLMMLRVAKSTFVPAFVPQRLTRLHGESWENSIRIETQTTECPNNALKLEALSVYLGPKCLFFDAEVKVAECSHQVEVEATGGNLKTIQAGTCYGLVGPNGCGKSTLLSLVADGRVPIPHTWDALLVGQILPSPTQRSPFEEANSRLLEVQEQLVGWSGAEEEVARTLLILGFQNDTQQRNNKESGKLANRPSLATPMNQLSGGWRMKVELAKAFWLKPKLLLLDEPTNHLDFQAIQWLVQQLIQYPHTLVVVSHDVGFLHGVCREILWINCQKVESLPRAMLSPKDLAQMQARRPLKFSFSVPEGESAGNHGVSFHEVQFSYARSENADGTSGFASRSPYDLQVGSGLRFSGRSRTVILGRNGSGKSTFLGLCIGRYDPTYGTVDRTPNCQVGFYSQHTEELNRRAEDTAAEYLARECHDALAARAGAAGASLPGARSRARQTVTYEKHLMGVARGVLLSFGFEGDMAVSIAVRDLSGGQKARLKLAVLSLRPAHILFLDEPTNHLDAEACEALANGLAEFQGGVVAVTHDDLFLHRLAQCDWAASELLVCCDGCILRQAALGATCLKALKEQARKSESGAAKDLLADKAQDLNSNGPQMQLSQKMTRLAVSAGQAPAVSDAEPSTTRQRSQSRRRKGKQQQRETKCTDDVDSRRDCTQNPESLLAARCALLDCGSWGRAFSALSRRRYAAEVLEAQTPSVCWQMLDANAGAIHGFIGGETYSSKLKQLLCCWSLR
ncbi:unnamed protein product [Polarella glacialis]|uniref:ABC transporter domain-containing protein n=1 Tax=Polarella glacialis TaxID=89957 RepID=A0A813GC98_POLGL|nr:unnamed protein product [Polarella glacialis]